MKSYTDIEQSKILAEILPIESADMCYRIVAYNPNDTHVYQPYCFSGTLESDIPCWSLAALLEIINKDFYTDLYHDGETWTVDVQHHDNEEMNDFVYADEPIDACVEMIVKLNEKGLI